MGVQGWRSLWLDLRYRGLHFFFEKTGRVSRKSFDAWKSSHYIRLGHSISAREDIMELQTLPDGRQALAARVERMVREKTSGLIRNLRVEVIPGEIVLLGRAATYYA